MTPNEPYLDSASLASVRAFVESHPALRPLVGSIARFKIVLDANKAISDLIHKHRKLNGELTALEEAVKSSAIEVHAPRWLDQEMEESTIQKAAAKAGIPEPMLRISWSKYREMIVFHDELLELDIGDRTGVDVKDIPYVALERAIGAVGIYSGDKDIIELGGTLLTVEFVLSVRSYARATSYVVGIRVGGAVVTYVSFGLIAGFAKAIAASISRLPPAAKLLLLAGAVFVVAHPRARERVSNLLSTAGDTLIDVWPLVMKLVETNSLKQAEAQAALSETERHLETSRALKAPPNNVQSR